MCGLRPTRACSTNAVRDFAFRSPEVRAAYVALNASDRAAVNRRIDFLRLRPEIDFDMTFPWPNDGLERAVYDDGDWELPRPCYRSPDT